MTVGTFEHKSNSHNIYTTLTQLSHTTYNAHVKCPDPLCIVGIIKPENCVKCLKKEAEGATMPKRWSKVARSWAYRYLVLRDGEQCARCHKVPTALNEDTISFPTARIKLEIDHIDGNPLNPNPSNLRLLCVSCNRGVENQRRSHCDQSVGGRVRDYVKAQEQIKGRIREEGLSSTRLAREVIPYQKGDATMQANFLYEVDFRNWILAQVKEKDFVLKQDAINAGAEAVGCSPNTTQRYLQKLTAFNGPLQEVRDMLGGINLILRPELDPEEKKK